MGGGTIAEKWLAEVLDAREKIMPITPFQAKIAKILACNRTPGSYLAGDAAMHFEPNSIRYSQDLDYFHDSETLVAEAYAADRALLIKEGYEIQLELHQPGYIRTVVRSSDGATKIEWAHDSAWRFMPTYFLNDRGFTLHPVDLAINKVLALAGRDEPRDYLDVLHAHESILELSGLVWAACGKDPGFTPHSLLELLQRKGRYRESDFQRLQLNIAIDLVSMKKNWLSALSAVHLTINRLPAVEVGCLYYHLNNKKFVVPGEDKSSDVVPHFASKGGILPRIK